MGSGYDVRNLVVFILFFWWVGISSAASFSQSDIEWNSPVSGTLYRGDTLMNGEYTVKAVEFSQPVPGIKNLQGNIVPEVTVYPMVYLEIYKNGALIKETALNMTNEPYIDPDYEVRVSVTGFLKRSSKDWVYEFYNPWADVSIQTRAKPELEVTVRTDKKTYTSYDDKKITATVSIINSGEAFARNVDVNLSTGGLKLQGGDISQLHQYYYRIDKNTVQSFRVTLVAPESAEETSYSLSADARGYDVKDLEYTAVSGATSLTLMPKQNYLTISKAVKDRIYLSDSETVIISVANGGIDDISDISLNDSMNENFELEQYAPMQWHIPVLKPGQEWSTAYSIKPLKASLSGFPIPAAVAKFTVNNKQYSASSERTTVVVNGPIITLNKTVDKSTAAPGDDVKVTVRIDNVGNIATRSDVRDSLPEGVSLVSGQLSLAPTFLESNSPQGFSYIIRVNKEGRVELPPAVANYTDIKDRGTSRVVLSSENPVINVAGPGEISLAPSTASTNTSQSKDTMQSTDALQSHPASRTPGFGGVFALIILLFATALRRK